jgi:hypothetical protein
MRPSHNALARGDMDRLWQGVRSQMERDGLL